MRRFIRIAMLTAIVFAATPAVADPAGNEKGECGGGLCGTPNPAHSLWDDLLAWLGFD